MNVIYELEPSELHRHFELIKETFARSIVETGRGRRLYQQIIPEEYREQAEKVIDMSRRELRKSRQMTADEILAMSYLVDYCMSL